jgi:hypothetical protein
VIVHIAHSGDRRGQNEALDGTGFLHGAGESENGFALEGKEGKKESKEEQPNLNTLLVP